MARAIYLKDPNAYRGFLTIKSKQDPGGLRQLIHWIEVDEFSNSLAGVVEFIIDKKRFSIPWGEIVLLVEDLD